LINYEGEKAILGTITDITERKRAEVALRIKDSAIASSINAIAMADLEGNLTYVNDSFLKLWEYDEDKEVLGKPTIEFWQDRNKASNVIETLYKTGSWIGELVAIRKDGGLFDVQFSANMVTDAADKPICMMASFVDITNRKRAEEQLQKYANDLEKMASERTAELANTTAFLNNILDSSTEYAIVATDLKGTILNWNTGARNIFGYDAEEVMGKEKVDIFYGDDFLHGKEKRNLLKAAIDDQDSNISSNNLRLMRKNGESFPADLTATYLRDAHGKRVGILGIIKDGTERKMLEQQLIQSEKMAGIGTLAAGIAHEVRNPLTIINTSTHLLREEIIGKTDEVEEDLFRQIEGGIKRMQTIVNTLLDFSRPAARELEFVDLRNLMEQVLVLEGKNVSTQNIQLKADLRETPKILGNLDSLKHIFLNLLLNAVQSMPEGGTLGIRTYQEDKRVKAEISDTGMGIPEETLSRIFDPFFTTKDPGEGTGLGLAIVHSQIERMGGTIRVESKPGLGSTFTVEFPTREHGIAGKNLTRR
jgi:PAS domain S-box-containing protein